MYFTGEWPFIRRRVGEPLKPAIMARCNLWEVVARRQGCDVSLPWELNSIHVLRLAHVNTRSRMTLLKECKDSMSRLVHKHHTPSGVCARHVSQDHASSERKDQQTK